MGGSKGGSKGGGGSKRKGPTKGQQKLASMGRAPKSYLGKTKAQQMATNRKVSGIGPVASGSAYAKSLGTATNQPSKKISGIGPVADGSTYARSLETAKKQRQFGADRLGLGSVSFDPKDSPSAFNYSKNVAGRLLTTGADIFAKPKFMYQGNKFGKAPGLSNFFSPDVGSAMPYRSGGWFKGMPFTKGDASGTITKFNVPKDAKLSRSVLGIRQYNLTPTQMKNLGMGVTDDVSKFAAKGFKKYATRAVPFVGAVPGVIDSVNRFKDKDYKGSALAFGSAIPGKIGWASLAGLIGHDAMKGRDQTQVASSDTGLNIGSVDSGETTEGSKTGRTIGKKISDFGKTAFAYGKDVFNQAFSPSLADGTLTGNTDFAGRLPGDKNFSNRDVQIKSAYNNAMNSSLVQQVGENLGLPKNWKTQTQDALSALGENYQGATADRDGIYKGTSETLKNLTLDKRLSPLSGYLAQLATENPNVSDADRDKNYSLFGIKTPLTNENVADIVSGFQPDAEKITGLSSEERGAIKGGLGNRLISGKLTDIAREALTGNIGTGESLGLSTGSPLTIGNMVDASKLIASNYNTEGTLAQQRSAEIGNLVSGGDITRGSIIRNILPFRGGRGGGRGSTRSGSTPNRTSGSEPTPIPPIPLPTTVQPQTGQTPANLAQLQQQAYNRQMAIYGSPNYSPQVRPLTRGVPRSYRAYFNRNYIV